MSQTDASQGQARRAASAVYAAPFELAPQRTAWVIVERSDVGLRRVDAPSDWLLAAAVATSSPNTLRSKGQSIAQFWDWVVRTGGDPLRIDAVSFARYIQALQQVPKGLALTSLIRALPDDPRLRSSSTVALRVTQIKEFYRWASANGWIASTAASAVLGMKTPKQTVRRTAPRLTEDQAQRLRTARLAPRERLAVELLYSAGLRDGEALGLRSDDLCFSREAADLFGCSVRGNAHLHVRRRVNPNGALAKSRTERVIPVTPRLHAAVRDWNAWAYDHLPEAVESAHLLVSLHGSTRGRPLSTTGFYSMWSSSVRSLEGLAGANPHLLRHTFASELADAGVPAFTIQTLLGHQSPNSTQVYTHALMGTLSEAVGRLGDWREQNLGTVDGR